MKEFIYHNPAKLYVGANHYDHLKEEVLSLGTKVLLIYGGGSIKRNGLYDKIQTLLEGITIIEYAGIRPNPEVSSIQEAKELAQKHDVDLILAVGGGSVIDAAKLIAASYYIDDDPWNIIKKKLPIEKALPIISILTLAATGSEMNGTTVISNDKSTEKMSTVSNLLIPKVSFLDPSLTLSVSRYQSACGTADIFAHIFETYFNTEGSLELLDSMMEAMMKTVIEQGKLLMQDLNNLEARSNLMYASTWAINGFIRSCQTCTWSCHSLGHALTAYYGTTHGESLAILIPKWMEYVLDDEMAKKFYRFGVNVLGIDSSLSALEVSKLAILKLKEFFYQDLGLDEYLKLDLENLDEVALKACKGTSIKGVKELGTTEAKDIYKMCHKD